MYGLILRKFGFEVNDKIIANFVDFVVPWLILLIAIIWQSFK